MAGLYRRGVQRSAGTPMMQVQGSQGAGGAVPRGFAPQQEQQNTNMTENAKTLGGLLGMLNQQKQAQQDIAPAMSAAEQATAATSALPDPSMGVGFGAAPSTDGNWGGVQASAFGSGIPTSTGEYQFNGAGTGMGLSSTPSMSGIAMPTAGAPAGPINIGQDYALAGQGANAAAMNAGKAVTEVQPQGLLDMLQSGWGALKGAFNFGGGAGA